MIGISTILPGQLDHTIIHGSSTLDKRENIARASRIKTLDGGIYINNGGVSEGDRSITVKETVTDIQADTLWEIFNRAENIHVSTQDGFFLGFFQKLTLDNGTADLTLWIKEKIG